MMKKHFCVILALWGQVLNEQSLDSRKFRDWYIRLVCCAFILVTHSNQSMSGQTWSLFSMCCRECWQRMLHSTKPLSGRWWVGWQVKIVSSVHSAFLQTTHATYMCIGYRQLTRQKMHNHINKEVLAGKKKWQGRNPMGYEPREFSCGNVEIKKRYPIFFHLRLSPPPAKKLKIIKIPPQTVLTH